MTHFNPAPVPEETAERMIKVINNTVIKDPVFGIFWDLFRVKPTNDIPTAATDCETLYFNPKFIESLNDRQIQSTFYHEVYHCLGETAGQDNRLTSFEKNGDDRYPITKRISESERKQIANEAADYEINSLIKQAGHELPPKVLYDAKYDNMSLDQILDDILKHLKVKNIYSSQPGDMSKGTDVLPVSDDVKNRWGRTNDYLSATGGIGSTPSPLGDFARKIRDIKYQPKIDWISLIKNAIRKKCGPVHYTYDRPSRRFISQGIYMPARVKEKIPCEVTVGVDVSGSMSDSDVLAALKEIDHITDQYPKAEKELSFVSTQVHGPFKIKGKFSDHPLEPKTTGGTFLTPFFAHYAEEPNQQNRVLVMFSDLEISSADASQIHDIVKQHGIRDVFWITNRPVQPSEVPVGRAMQYYPP